MDWNWPGLWWDVFIPATVSAALATASLYRQHQTRLVSNAVPFPPIENNNNNNSMNQSHTKSLKEEFQGKLVLVTGLVRPLSSRAIIHHPSSPCVARLTTTSELSTTFDYHLRIWLSTSSKELHRVVQQLPFYLSKSGRFWFSSHRPLVVVPHNVDLESTGLVDALVTASSNFTPVGGGGGIGSGIGIPQSILDMLQGYRILGYQTTERILPLDQNLSAIGYLDFSKKVEMVVQRNGYLEMDIVETGCGGVPVLTSGKVPLIVRCFVWFSTLRFLLNSSSSHLKPPFFLLPIFAASNSS